LSGVAVATLSRLVDDQERFKRYYINAVSMIAFVGMPLSALLTVMGRDVILLLLGPQWSLAGKIFSIFGPGIPILLIYSTHGWLHVSLGRTDRWLYWSIINAIGTISAFGIGSIYGAKGIAAAYTISLYILIGPCLAYAGRPVGLGFFAVFSVVWRYYTAALGAGSVLFYMFYLNGITSVYLTQIHVFPRIILSFIFFIPAYIVLVIVIHGNIRPITQFISLVREMKP